MGSQSPDTRARQSRRIAVWRFARPHVGYAVALATVGLVSLVIALVVQRAAVANISMVYLLAVLGSAILFGRGPAVLASVASFLTFDWFFIEPRHAPTVADPEEWVALLLFLVTAIVTSELAARQRQRAHEARRSEREAIVLYDVARLMGAPDFDQALTAVAERLRQELQLAAVAIQIGGAGLPPAEATVGDEESLDLARSTLLGPTRLLGTGPSPTGSRRGEPGRWIRIVPPASPDDRARLGRGDRERVHVVPVKAQNARVGSISVVRTPGALAFGEADDRLLSAVAAQLGLAVERARLRREATEAEILRRADDLKSALLNAVSHDLRTPLAGIITGAESLLRQDVAWSAADRIEFAESIRAEALRLNRIVLNLLDLSRIEAGSLRPQKGWYDLRALVDDALGRLRPVVERHPVVVDVPEDLPPIDLDYVEVEQVLSNLVENAAKHTPDGTRIEVRARVDGGQVLVEVSDDGPGIPTEALPHLFEPFFRAEALHPRPKGLGLGLAVARGLVEAHGGRICASNRPEGGACFAFTLPLDVPASAQPADGAEVRR